MACCLVHHIDRLVRQKALGDVTLRQPGSGDQRIIRDPHTVMKFVFFLQPAQHEDRVLDRWLINKDRLEPAGQRRVLFHILTVFIQRCRADTAQLAPRQRRFQQVRCIHRPIGLAGTDKLMHLVDKQHHLAIA